MITMNLCFSGHLKGADIGEVYDRNGKTYHVSLTTDGDVVLQDDAMQSPEADMLKGAVMSQAEFIKRLNDKEYFVGLTTILSEGVYEYMSMGAFDFEI